MAVFYNTHSTLTTHSRLHCTGSFRLFGLVWVWFWGLHIFRLLVVVLDAHELDALDYLNPLVYLLFYVCYGCVLLYDQGDHYYWQLVNDW